MTEKEREMLITSLYILKKDLNFQLGYLVKFHSEFKRLSKNKDKSINDMIKVIGGPLEDIL